MKITCLLAAAVWSDEKMNLKLNLKLNLKMKLTHRQRLPKTNDLLATGDGDMKTKLLATAVWSNNRLAGNDDMKTICLLATAVKSQNW